MKLLRVTTVPTTLNIILKDQLIFLSKNGVEVYTASALDHKTELTFSKEHFAIELTRSINILKDLRAIWQLYGIIKKHRFDIVHSNTPKAGLVGMAAATLAGINIRIHSVGGLPLMEKTGPFKWVLTLIERLVYALATNVWVNSSGLLAYVKKYISNSKKIEMLGFGATTGVDLDFFKKENIDQIAINELHSTYKIDPNDFVWIFIGRLVKDKGLNELLSAFDQLGKGKLLLLGDYENNFDPLSEASMDIIKYNKSVLSIGFVNDIRPFLAMSTVLVLPSYREGLPNVLMQAAAMEVPIITTDINGCNEIVTDGVNGLLVPSKNTGALLAAMQKLYQSETLRTSLKQKTRNLIKERYSSDFIQKTVLENYQSLAANV